MPGNTKSLAIVANDPDAPDPGNPKITWVHLVVYDISPSVRSLSESGLQKNKISKEGIKQGTTDFKTIGHGSPCPPIGRHRYFFKLYALSKKTNLPAGLTKNQLLNEIKDIIIKKVEIIGTYQKN
ncbi:MAG: YbhB/YbcL family Raf kinase inhibitor-like protein [Bacteriovoracaceae bacterium]|nr:YbhB/YbcL family Raf kinase inhibitor-like protein [Bacteriovoracaceae bacterium]